MTTGRFGDEFQVATGMNRKMKNPSERIRYQSNCFQLFHPKEISFRLIKIDAKEEAEEEKLYRFQKDIPTI